MSAGRSIQLDLGMPTSKAFDRPDTSSEHSNSNPKNTDNLADDAQRLRELLKQQYDRPVERPVESLKAASPFDLFGGRVADQGPTSGLTTPAVDTSRSGPPVGLEAALTQMAGRLLVNDGSSGQRAVRITLADEGLQGVEVEVLEEAGDLLARFSCSLESSRVRLAANAQWLADELARSLQRSVHVCVQTDDPEDLCPVEASAPRLDCSHPSNFANTR